MTKVAILPVFTLKPGQRDAFLTRVRQQRDDCLEKEPGCLHFDVLHEDGVDTVSLYEIYVDAEALQKHRTYPHYADFKATTDPMVEVLTIHRYTLDG